MDYLCVGAGLWAICSLAGAAIAGERNAGWQGMAWGLFLGPVGVLVAFSLDGRPQCPACGTRLPLKVQGYGFKYCPSCKCQLDWSDDIVTAAKKK